MRRPHVSRWLSYNWRSGTPRLYVKLCIILLQDDSPQARELISDLLVLDEDLPPQNASQIALRLLDLGVERNPTSATLLAQRAGLYRIALKNTEAARTDLQAAVDLQPTDPGVLLELYKEWAALGDLERASAQLRALDQLDANDLAKYDIDTKEFVEKYPSDPRLYGKLCIILLRDDSFQVRELILKLR